MTLTDPYSLCESGVIRKMQTLKQYFPKDYQVGKDDTVIAGQGDFFFIIRPGAFPVKPFGGKQYDFHWEIEAEIFCRFKRFKTTPDDFRAFRWDIINALVSDPRLDGTINVWHVLVAASDKTQYFKFAEEDENPAFITQTLTVTVSQRIRF